MEEIEEKNKIRRPTGEIKRELVKNIKREVEQNYEIGIEYFMNLEEYKTLKDSK